MDLVEQQRTGYVQITYVGGRKEVVKADSFGEAASQVYCSDGQIKCFNWSQHLGVTHDARD